MTEGTIIVRDDPDADLSGLNRDITKAREITKDDQINVDVYVSPGAIEEIYHGFAGITGQIKQYANEIKALKAELPSDLENLGEPGLDALKNMLRNGMEEDAAVKVMRDPGYQKLLAKLTNFEEGYRAARSGMSVEITIDGERILSNSEPEVTVGQYTLSCLNEINRFVRSIPYEEERAAVLFGLQLAMGGPAKFIITAAKDAIAGTVLSGATEYICDNVAAYLYSGMGYDAYADSELAKYRASPSVNQTDSDEEFRVATHEVLQFSSDSVQLGLTLVGVVSGSIWKIAKGSSGGKAAAGSGGSSKAPEKMLGEKGSQFPSQTIWNDRSGKGRLDVENPNPGQRAGQIHYQEKNSDSKYLYDPETNSFPGTPRRVNALLKMPEFQKAIAKGLRYLGE